MRRSRAAASSSYLRIGCVLISTAAHWRPCWNPGGSASPDRFFTIRVVVSSQHRCERSSISPARSQHERRGSALRADLGPDGVQKADSSRITFAAQDGGLQFESHARNGFLRQRITVPPHDSTGSALDQPPLFRAKQFVVIPTRALPEIAPLDALLNQAP